VPYDGRHRWAKIIENRIFLEVRQGVRQNAGVASQPGCEFRQRSPFALASPRGPMQQIDFGFAGTAGATARTRAPRREADWRRQLARGFVYATEKSPSRRQNCSPSMSGGEEGKGRTSCASGPAASSPRRPPGAHLGGPPRGGPHWGGRVARTGDAALRSRSGDACACRKPRLPGSTGGQRYAATRGRRLFAY
jgi:hypothetical protein